MKSRLFVVAACICALAASPPGDAGGRGDGGVTALSSPVRLAQANNGNLVVSDYQARRVVELSGRELAMVRSFDVEGRPLAVALAGGRVLVGNESTRRVEAYNRSGRKLFDLGGPDCEFLQPTDIAIDSSLGLVFVVDGHAGVVKVFDVSVDEIGSLVRTIPEPGPDPSVLASPTGIALDTGREEVLVSDFGTPESGVRPRVQIFDYAGNLLATISGRAGMLGNRFSRPQGLAVDGSGHIFLVDSWLGRVIVLDRASGAQLGSLGTYGRGPGELALPLDIVINGSSGDVLVTNNRSARIEVFAEGALLP